MTQKHQKLSLYSMAWSPNWAELFGAERPLIVEIGFGNGAYLLELARRHPDYNIIGFEISSKSLEKAEKKIQSARLNNALVVFSRAESALTHLLPPESVHAFHINYPDPWFKSRHAERRLIQRDTLDSLVSRLVVGGKLHLATDILDYAEMSHELLSQTPSLTNCYNSAWLPQDPHRFIMTKYERKGYTEGRTGHYFLYERNATPAPIVPLVKELEMPHIILETPLTPQELLQKYEKQYFNPAPDIHIATRDAFIDQSGRALLIEILAQDPTLEQHIGLMLFPREEQNTYTLRYTTLGQPRATVGLHYATALLAEWLVSLHPQAKILSRMVSV